MGSGADAVNIEHSTDVKDALHAPRNDYGGGDRFGHQPSAGLPQEEAAVLPLLLQNRRQARPGRSPHAPPSLCLLNPAVPLCMLIVCLCAYTPVEARARVCVSDRGGKGGEGGREGGRVEGGWV